MMIITSPLYNGSAVDRSQHPQCYHLRNLQISHTRDQLQDIMETVFIIAAKIFRNRFRKKCSNCVFKKTNSSQRDLSKCKDVAVFAWNV